MEWVATACFAVVGGVASAFRASSAVENAAEAVGRSMEASAATVANGAQTSTLIMANAMTSTGGAVSNAIALHGKQLLSASKELRGGLVDGSKNLESGMNKLARSSSEFGEHLGAYLFQSAVVCSAVYAHRTLAQHSRKRGTSTYYQYVALTSVLATALGYEAVKRWELHSPSQTTIKKGDLTIQRKASKDTVRTVVLRKGAWESTMDEDIHTGRMTFVTISMSYQGENYFRAGGSGLMVLANGTTFEGFFNSKGEITKGSFSSPDGRYNGEGSFKNFLLNGIATKVRYANGTECHNADVVDGFVKKCADCKMLDGTQMSGEFHRDHSGATEIRLHGSGAAVISKTNNNSTVTQLESLQGEFADGILQSGKAFYNGGITRTGRFAAHGDIGLQLDGPNCSHTSTRERAARIYGEDKVGTTWRACVGEYRARRCWMPELQLNSILNGECTRFDGQRLQIANCHASNWGPLGNKIVDHV